MAGTRPVIAAGTRVALKSRAWQYNGVREFEAGGHNVRIRFSLPRLYCKAYLDGKLAVRDVFPKMQQDRAKVRKSVKKRGPVWLAATRAFLIVYVCLAIVDTAWS